MGTAKNYILGTVKLTEWDNDGIHSYRMKKSYKDDKDEWQTTDSFNERDLLKLKLLIDRVLQSKIKEVR